MTLRETFEEAPELYDRARPGYPGGLFDDLEANGRFDRPVFRRYEHEQTYSAQEYRDLLLSYSGHRALEPAARRGLLSCITRLIDERYGGRITKRYLNELAFASFSAGNAGGG